MVANRWSGAFIQKTSKDLFRNSPIKTDLACRVGKTSFQNVFIVNDQVIISAL